MVKESKVRRIHKIEIVDIETDDGFKTIVIANGKEVDWQEVCLEQFGKVYYDLYDLNYDLGDEVWDESLTKE